MLFDYVRTSCAPSQCAISFKIAALNKKAGVTFKGDERQHFVVCLKMDRSEGECAVGVIGSVDKVWRVRRVAYCTSPRTAAHAYIVAAGAGTRFLNALPPATSRLPHPNP